MKIALVTGSSRGLGRSMALHLSQQGIGVVVTFNQGEKEAQSVVNEIQQKGGQAVALQLDAGDTGSFQKFSVSLKEVLQARWARNDFDFLVNNAGIGINSPISDMSVDQFDQLLNVHFRGPFFLTQKLLPMIKDGGRILNISSGLARFSFEGFAAYASMKGAMEIFTKYLAKELGPRKITANILAPGPVETDFGGGTTRDNKDVNQFLASITPLGRVGLPSDIGGAVSLLLSAEAGWINGQRIEVSGGILL